MEPVSAAVIAGLVVKAAQTFGQKVFDQVADAVAEDAAGLGRRLLHRLLGTRTSSAEVAVQTATQDVIAAPGDEDAQAALRWRVRQLLEADPQVRSEVQAMVSAAPEAVLAIGGRAAAVRGDGNTVITGDNVSTHHPPP
jgi:hypothetical protein